jgi:Rod binding domain-containing protein
MNLSVQATVASGSSGAPSPRLVRAAHEFEGQMMKELLKPMMNSDALTGAGEDDSDSGIGGTGSEGALAGFVSEALGQAMSERGGFGIANRIVRDLTQPGHRHGNEKVTTQLHRNTEMSTTK